MSRTISNPITLSYHQQNVLKALLRGGKVSVRAIHHAQILLQTHEGYTDKDIANSLHVSTRTVSRARERFIEKGFEAALYHKKPVKTRNSRLDGRGEAKLIQLACSEPPEGYTRWTLRLLADKMIELEVVPFLAHETVRKTLKKTNFRLT